MFLSLLLLSLFRLTQGSMTLIKNTDDIVFNFNVNLYAIGSLVSPANHECFNISAATKSGTNQFLKITYTTSNTVHW